MLLPIVAILGYLGYSRFKKSKAPKSPPVNCPIPFDAKGCVDQAALSAWHKKEHEKNA